MPAEEVERRQVDGRWLLGELRADPDRLVLLDCRSSVEYAESHIRHALNFSIPSIMLRRLAAGKIDLVSTIKCKRLKERIVAALKESLFVLYGEEGVRHAIAVLADRLVNDGCRVVCVSGEWFSFNSATATATAAAPVPPDIDFPEGPSPSPPGGLTC
ncbi:hypothetical protein AAG570_005169 [Ranatra chinensis]|uniref:Rhodanese domain-containing protein n=1 Tax=Ranatra chinensis TaxID=642074 RepID=A0ABD0Y0K7_9HEMI